MDCNRVTKIFSDFGFGELLLEAMSWQDVLNTLGKGIPTPRVERVNEFFVIESGINLSKHAVSDSGQRRNQVLTEHCCLDSQLRYRHQQMSLGHPRNR